MIEMNYPNKVCKMEFVKIGRVFKFFFLYFVVNISLCTSIFKTTEKSKVKTVTIAPLSLSN